MSAGPYYYQIPWRRVWRGLWRAACWLDRPVPMPLVTVIMLWWIWLFWMIENVPKLRWPPWAI